MKIHQTGFTLIEIILFIIITGILASSILLAFTTGLQKSPKIHQQMVATFAAEKCMDWFLGQRFFNGYAALSCPSTTVPSFCSVPSGYSISVNISCVSISGDANYQSIQVAISGAGNATLTSLIGDY